ncbi:hypothetical protein GCM10012275_60620 [Longimycelium tulufanense]|uniref:Uncharacterized protein n=1 Tax=Longimycelium tulufanense TaxID=907463 RepID=A0A8J3CEI0_9PSEU|nr:hypothetical protein [Longimycelium tulufanense]GGM81893.1 hypothetical protein GCM10012275_60620 [Longimycelium tulufanense]
MAYGAARLLAALGPLPVLAGWAVLAGLLLAPGVSPATRVAGPACLALFFVLVHTPSSAGTGPDNPVARTRSHTRIGFSKH